MEKCNCRFQICDMGYFECELNKGHSGTHQFTHNHTKKDPWPEREYTITWKQDPNKDFIINEDFIKDETNFESLVSNVIDSTTYLTHYNWYFNDDALYGATPVIWLNVGYDGTYPTDSDGYGEVFKEESKLYTLMEESLKTKDGKRVYDYNIQCHIQMLPTEEV